MTRSAALIACLLAPLAALAQTQTAGTAVVSPATLGSAACTSTTSYASIAWTVTTTTGVITPGSDTFEIIASTASCPTAAGTTTTGIVAANVAVPDTTGSSSFSVLESTIISAAGLTCTSGDTTINICVYLLPPGGSIGSQIGTAFGTVALQVSPPAVPAISSVTAGDGALFVSWSAGTGSSVAAASYTVSATSPSDVGPYTASTVNTSVRLGGLTNGVTYSVTVAALSAGGNESAASAAVAGTPQAVNDFWAIYKADGGVEQGGCGGGPAGALSLLGLAAAALLRRRRARRERGRRLPAAPLVAALGLLLAPAVAHAQSASPIFGSFELRVGGYRPNIDSAFSGVGPYQSIFGTGAPLMFRGIVSGAVWRGFGTLELGAQLGYWNASGHGLYVTGGGVSPEPTTLRIIPTSAVVTYRLDVLFERWNFPVIPYGRASLDRYNWTVTGSGGVTSQTGATSGYSYGGGLALVLDFFDPGSARDMDQDVGINHVMVVADLTKPTIRDFGSAKSWNLSPAAPIWSFGLLFVF